MAKLFITSDIHSYFNELKLALDRAGFDENNEDHWLVVCEIALIADQIPRGYGNFYEHWIEKC